MAKKNSGTFPAATLEQVPELIDYLDARNAIEALEEDPAVREYRAQLERYNAAREQADKALRAKGLSYGAWQAYQTRVKYDAEKLCQLLGEKVFRAVGGTIETQFVYAVDKTKLEGAFAMKKINPDLRKEVCQESLIYHAPKEVVLP
jgi:hypothetical protein